MRYPSKPPEKAEERIDDQDYEDRQWIIDIHSISSASEHPVGSKGKPLNQKPYHDKMVDSEEMSRRNNVSEKVNVV